MSFLETWKKKLDTAFKDWRGKMQSAAIESTYAFIAGTALGPAAAAIASGDPDAWRTLIMLTGGVGCNLIANVLQNAKDGDEIARKLEVMIGRNEALLRQVDEVMEGLSVISTARSGLDDHDRDWFTTALRQELERLGNLERYETTIMDSSGPTAIGPHAKAEQHHTEIRADSIGKVVIGTEGTQDDLRRRPGKEPSVENGLAALNTYLTRFTRACRALPLAAMGADEGAESDVTLEDVYISLNTTTPKEEDREKIRDEDRSVGLRGSGGRKSAIEVARDTTRLVLLGDPGAGKSTFVRYLLARQAQRLLSDSHDPDDMLSFARDLLPVLVTLRNIAPELSCGEFHGIPSEECRRRLRSLLFEHIRSGLSNLGSQAFADGIGEALETGRCFLVLDGLDEVPESLRPLVRTMVSALVQGEMSRIIVTCRVRSYGADSKLAGFGVHRLDDLQPDQIRDFAAAWYRAQEGLGRIEAGQWNTRAQDLAQAATGSDLQVLSRNPMMLTSMAILHQREVGLPRERVKFYSQVVDILLRKWQRAKFGRERATGALDEETDLRLAKLLDESTRVRQTMERLAYEAQGGDASGEGGKRRQAGADLSRGDVISVLGSPRCLGDLTLAEAFLEYVDQRAGVFIGRGSREGKPASYAFPHRTVQEYLAGAHLITRRPLVREYTSRLGDPERWALALQLGAEEFFFNNPAARAECLELIYSLVEWYEQGERGESRDNHERALLWAANVAVSVGANALVADETRGDGEEFVDGFRWKIVRLLSGELGAVDRFAAGDALAKLEDPRPDVMTVDGMVLVPIRPGTVNMGSDHGRENERPWCKMKLPEFAIGLYPVTNAQFDEFVRDGGYAREDLWVEGKAAGYWRQGALRDWLDDNTRAAPFSYGEPFSLPNHPVVGITWYEALAFCRWVDERWKESGRLRGGWSITLPSEAEWEWVAKGDSERSYPWGDASDPERANMRDSNIGSTSAVGVFAKGASKNAVSDTHNGGVQDLSGNVWEWTRSAYRKYPYDESCESLGADAATFPRGLRGGCYFYESDFVRCSVRVNYVPDFWDYYIGFRIVASPFRGA